MQSTVTSLDNWSGCQADRTDTINDPLVEQINIIKGYIKQARDALRFEEVSEIILLVHNSHTEFNLSRKFQVETLEINLRELQQEFYNRQQQFDANRAQAQN